MIIHPIILWTDALLYLLVIAVSAAIMAARHSEHWRAAWHRVLVNRMALVAMSILLLYIVVGLLDSIHFEFQPKNETPITSKVSSIILLVLCAITLKKLTPHRLRHIFIQLICSFKQMVASKVIMHL